MLGPAGCLTDPDLVAPFLVDFRGLYRGAGWTAARNAPGSFALFGGSAIVHHGVYGLEHAKEATVMQNFVASIAGAVASITVAAPLDVVKTRVQNKPFDAPESGEGVSVLNPKTDYTPPDYITLIFTDLGVLTPAAVSDELINQ